MHGQAECGKETLEFGTVLMRSESIGATAIGETLIGEASSGLAAVLSFFFAPQLVTLLTSVTFSAQSRRSSQECRKAHVLGLFCIAFVLEQHTVKGVFFK